jgi:hypothetical protein
VGRGAGVERAKRDRAKTTVPNRLSGLDEVSDALDKLSKNKCIEVVVRLRTTWAALNAAMQNCDEVYIIAHGGAQAPYFNLAGNGAEGAFDGSTASSCTIFSCQGQVSSAALTQQNEITTFGTMPNEVFDGDGNAAVSRMVQELAKALKRLNENHSNCCGNRRRICVMAGTQKLLHRR